MDRTSPAHTAAHGAGPVPVALPDPRHAAAPMPETLPLPAVPVNDRAALLLKIRTLQANLQALLGREVGP